MINIRSATKNNVDSIWELRAKAIKQTCLTHYPKEIVLKWASSPMPANFEEVLIHLNAIVAEDTDPNKPVSLLGFGFIDKERSKLESLFVDPQASRRGVGRLIATTLVSIARQANLSRLQLSSTLNAVAFYQSIGFEILAETNWQHPADFELASVSMEIQIVEEIKDDDV
ncbi:GNAT family N-acetyltransferase [Shewanella sp. D64]|uniref:GNAT family N-acetyltransferase n=1 Tax=unclassified Shewanella TaxID=196818 RepID=UPI0022BA68BB|nr:MULTISPECIES: GNAT family N-acetyltransferase [unclassified Shewanella]MEC4725738.1 GNAT family N-acetyltransferase [Shewanella sp. D64]MEC4737655.1 GNAT family N-acetyltransferase [Shewanella sp. E94]WBJ93464.1 GNAT family N-acetyltransferase [Shewanella sp. MTB7]